MSRMLLKINRNKGIYDEMNEALNIASSIINNHNPRMALWQAVQLYEYGLDHMYCTDPVFRQAYNMWCDTEFAGFNFYEFSIKCGIPLSEFQAAQDVVKNSIIQ